MTSIQEICARSGRQLQAVPPVEVAGQALRWEDIDPWQQIESPEPSAVIFVAPEQHREEWAPNVIATCATISPPMAADEALHAIAGTAMSLDNWQGIEDVAGEGDPDAGGPQSVYRYIRGIYDADPGRMATSSLLAAWNDDERTYVFQFIATTWQESVDSHEQAFECARLGDWTAGDIVNAMRG